MLTDRGTALREAVLDACVAEGFSPVPLLEVGDPATLRDLVHAGLGVSVVPASWVHAPARRSRPSPSPDPDPAGHATASSCSRRAAAHPPAGCCTSTCSAAGTTSDSSRASRALGRAPMSLRTAAPSRNTMNVGMDRMP